MIEDLIQKKILEQLEKSLTSDEARRKFAKKALKVKDKIQREGGFVHLILEKGKTPKISTVKSIPKTL